MDLGVTKSPRHSGIHYITGSIVVVVGYTAILLTIRALFA